MFICLLHAQNNERQLISSKPETMEGDIDETYNFFALCSDGLYITQSTKTIAREIVKQLVAFQRSNAELTTRDLNNICATIIHRCAIPQLNPLFRYATNKKKNFCFFFFLINLLICVIHRDDTTLMIIRFKPNIRRIDNPMILFALVGAMLTLISVHQLFIK